MLPHRIAGTSVGLLAAAVGGMTAAPALAQWTVTNLHPTGAIGSYAFGCSGGQQVGVATVGVDRAYMWRGTAASAVDLSMPASVGSSRANFSGDGFQVGRAFVNGVTRAGMWNGSSAWVDLNPTGTSTATESEAFAVHGAQQVGRARFNGGVADVASLWGGSAQSWVHLIPAQSTVSAAYGVYNGMQVGYAVISNVPRAGTWHGTPGSWVSIHPAGATGSIAYAVHEDRIVGTVSMNGITRASMWNSSTGPWVDLNPPNSTESRASAVHQDIEVGFVRIGGVSHASLWRGTAASWEDLSLALTGSWGATTAQGVWNDLTTTYVAGYGFNNDTHRNEALLWTRALVPAACYANCDGSTAPPALNANDFQCFLNAFAGGGSGANCDGSTVAPILNANDFQCFLNRFAAGCP